MFPRESVKVKATIREYMVVIMLARVGLTKRVVVTLGSVKERLVISAMG